MTEFEQLTIEEREDEVINYFEGTDKPFTTANDVAEEFNTERAYAYRTLENLLKSGYFKKERIGAGGVVYYHVEE